MFYLSSYNLLPQVLYMHNSFTGTKLSNMFYSTHFPTDAENIYQCILLSVSFKGIPTVRV